MSALEKYNLSMVEFLGFDAEVSRSVYEEGIFQIGRDFKLSLHLSKKNFDETYIAPTADDIFQVTEMDTFVNGRCLKITSLPEVTFEVLEMIAISVKLHKNIDEADRPFIQFDITSEKNSYGTLLGHWFDGKGFMIEANSNDSKIFYDIAIETKKSQKLKPECLEEENTIQCASKRYFHNLT